MLKFNDVGLNVFNFKNLIIFQFNCVLIELTFKMLMSVRLAMNAQETQNAWIQSDHTNVNVM